MSWMMRQSSRASPGQSTALLILMMRPSTCVTVPSSSSCRLPGKHDVGVPRRVVEEEIDGGVELELLQAARDERVVGQRDLRVEADRESALDLARVDLAEQLVGVDAGPGQVLFVDAPDAGDVAAMLRVADVAPAGQLIAFLPVLAPALSVGLADDGAVAALRFADSARREDQIDRAERVLDAVRVVLDAARVKQKAGLAPCPTTPPPASGRAAARQ